MNTFNKNVRRTVSIFVLLTLCVGLCFEVAAFPLDVMAVGELHELDGGYSIKVEGSDQDRGIAWFVLYKEGIMVGEGYASSGNRFSLDDGEIFHFEATLDSIFRSDDTTMVHLTEYDWWGELEPESVYDWPEWEAESWGELEPEMPIPEPPPEMFPPDVMAVGELHELDGGYSIKVEEADAERGKALFALVNEEGRAVDETTVSRGKRFRLNDGEIFHFEATLDSVFHTKDTIMVHLVDYHWEWSESQHAEELVPTPTATPKPTLIPKPTETGYISTTGTIAVSSSPSSAYFYLDGKYQGTTPKTISDVPHGAHEIVLKKSGYEDWSKSVYVDAIKTIDVSTTLTPTLTPKPTLTPTPTQPETGNIIVSTNIESATFIISGPATYSESGTSWSKEDAPAGIYTIAYGAVSGYDTPLTDTKTLPTGGLIKFTGEYESISQNDWWKRLEVIASIIVAICALAGGILKLLFRKKE